MASEWKKHRIKDVVSFVVDNRGKTPPTQDEGHILLEVNAVSATEKFPLYREVRKHVSQEVYDTRFRKGHPKKGDILVPTVGTLGAVSLMDRDDCCIAQNLIAIRCDEAICHNHFLYYVLCNPMTRKRLLNLNIGGVQPSIKVPHLMELEIELPSIQEQKKIAELLSLLDDKIFCNKRINDNLQQQLHLLYLHVFGDSDVDTPLGDVVTTASGGTPSRKHDEYYSDGSICWVKSKELVGGYIHDTEEHINDLAVDKSSAKILPLHSVLIAMYGATVGAYGIISKPMTCNQAVCALLSNERYPYTYLFQIAYESQQKLINLAVGSAQQNISQVLIKQLLIHSDFNAIQKFHSLARPMHEKMASLQTENIRLSEIRDSLLPKLMSGEIDVSNIEI